MIYFGKTSICMDIILNHGKVFCHHCQNHMDPIHLLDCLGRAVLYIFGNTNIYMAKNTNIVMAGKNNMDPIHLVDRLGGAVPSIGPSVTGLQVAILDLRKI